MCCQADTVLDSTTERALIAGLTRDVIDAAAPEELGVFAADESGWIAGRVGAAGRQDEMLGFGAEAAVVLLTPYVVAAATAAVRYIGRVLADLADEQAHSTVTRWVRHLLRQDADEPAGEPLPVLPTDFVRRVRDVTYGTCHDMGLPDDEAALVSDAVAGRLALSCG